MNDQNFLGNKLVKVLKELNLVDRLKTAKQKKYTFSEIIKAFQAVQDENSFLIRYSKVILEQLLIENRISVDLFNEFKQVFDYLKLKFPETSSEVDGNELPKPSDYEKYFEVLFLSDFYYDQGDEFFNEIKSNYKTSESKTKNCFYIHINDTERFFERYGNCKGLSWLHLSSETNILWTNELITKYQKNWDWRYLHRNQAINWNFDLIERNVDFLNWAYISSYESLIWDKKRINQFKDYLIFAINNENGHRTNMRGRRYEIQDGHVSTPKWCKDFKGCISLNENIDWTYNLIEAFKEYWGWKELCSNQAIYWSFDQIKKLEIYIDFKSLSLNRNVEWCEDLIANYIDKWDWEALSGNELLPWSYNFIKKHETRWNWINKIRTDISKSLSTNTGIYWSERMLEEWEAKLNFWEIARYGGISNDSVIKYNEKFYENKVVGAKYHRWSDWSHTEHFYCSGWENLGLNPNFKISPLLIEFLFGKTSTKTITLGDNARDMCEKDIKVDLLGSVISGSIRFTGVEGGNYYIQDEKYFTNTENLSLKDLIENELEWTKYFISEDYIHKSVWDEIINPIFTDEYLKVYMTNLRYYMDYENDI